MLNNTNMPSVLHETAFITNSAEEDMLNSADWQNGFVNSVGGAILGYLGISPVEVTVPVVERELYRAFFDDVQKGTYAIKENALKMAEEILSEISSGNVKIIASNGKIVLDKTKVIQDPGTNPPQDGFKHPISGTAQAILETNYFRFTGVVKPEQNNFCGLGATGPDNPGIYFPNDDYGIKAHIQHL